MKILELCLSDGVGGLELYALRTAKQFSGSGIGCIAVVKKGTMLSERMQTEGVRTVLLRSCNRFLPLVAARRLAAIIDREAVDVIHMHWGADINLAVLAKRCAQRKVKLVYTRQMMITRSKKDAYHRFLYRHIGPHFAFIGDFFAKIGVAAHPFQSGSQVSRIAGFEQ